MSIIEDKELYQQGNVWKLQLEANDSQKSKGKWRPRFTKSFMLLVHNSTRLLEFGLSIFVANCSSLSEVRQCSNLGMSRFISLTKLRSAHLFIQELHISPF